jgi:endonuclease-8
MHEALAGDVVTISDFRVPRLATTDLAGRHVLDATARGKHLLIRLEGELTLHTHFEMDGIWRIFAPGERWSGGPAHEIRVVLGTDRKTAVGYRIPVIDVVATASEPELVGHLGPDLLDDAFDADEAIRRIAAAPAVGIADALLDQRNLAGIGNVYKCEALFLSGVDPWTPAGEVPDLMRLVDLARRLMVANRDRETRITTGVRRPGEQTWVYGRAARPCRRCGTVIGRRMQGDRGRERVTFWCGQCQT